MQGHFRLTGNVVLSQVGMKFYADVVDYYPQTNRLLATGNVLLEQVDHQIAADRADFNALTRLGTFYNARGFASLGTRADVSQFGTLQPDVQFYGETIEKTGPDTYLISHGGFTTCAQANPRWEMTSGSIKLRVDHYALLQNMLLKAKGVPVLFLPVFYYPISNDNRQTGFLMPSYGSSTYEGQVHQQRVFLGDRPQPGRDVPARLVLEDRAGGERRIPLRGPARQRQPADQFHRQPSCDLRDQRGVEHRGRGAELSADREHEPGTRRDLVCAGAGQLLFQHQRSATVERRPQPDLATEQIAGRIDWRALRGYRITGTYDRNEAFTGTTSSNVRGSAPRINVSRPDRLLGPVPVYASVNTEYVHLAQQDHNFTAGTVTRRDIDRLDIQPVLRFPFNRLTFLSFNTSLMWRNTFWSDSQLANGTRLPAPISRRFLELSATFNGPTFVRIFDAPKSQYAQRFKHTIEPFLQVTHRTPIENANQIIPNEYVDAHRREHDVVCLRRSTRLYAKRTAEGPLAVARRNRQRDHPADLFDRCQLRF